MNEYFADDGAIDEPEFIRRACDPQASVVVEACAGSGKTWLLVSRILRALLAGAAPGEVLAITFTRRAAQEMRSRLFKDLRQLAAADDAAIVDFLAQRGMSAAEARAAIVPARQLYERVAVARVPPTIETFHGWFWQLVTRAPLGAGVPFAPVLQSSTDSLRGDAWLHFSADLLRESNAAARAAWESLIDALGDVSARLLIEQLLHKRAEWWCFAAGNEDAAVARALEPLRAAGDVDPAGGVRETEFVSAVKTLHDALAAMPKPSPSTAALIAGTARWLDEAAVDAGVDMQAICDILLTQKLTPREALTPAKLGKHLAAGVAARYAEAHLQLIEQLDRLRAARRTWCALQINRAALICGRLLIATYQRLKARQQVLDFTDLEWHAHTLLADADNAAYMQARLDARYRHILLDEFQDTNPLQWQVLQSWLAAYGPPDESAGMFDRPRVFVVGDPKQSIYRFRRAEPRVFDAAAALLRRDYGGSVLRTHVTRRNAQRVIEVLNCVMPANPLYRTHSTLAPAAGEFVLLPLSPPPAPAVDPPDTDALVLRDALATPRAERATDTRYREGRVIANEIASAVARLRVRETDPDHDRGARWSDVLLLVRRRTHLADYERALRDAGVPFVSDRAGGLLDTLESDDLIALLEFLSAPFNDLKLAQALRSPIFDCGDDDLIRLAGADGAGWWLRLQSIDTQASAPLARARDLLARWLNLAGVLPVHDLLDRIYFEGDVRRRYAAVVPATLHAQAQANLDAFIELALNVDAGRYPSLSRFIDELSRFRREAGDDAPDEGATAAGDAVRVLTVHGAKGLEAEIVVLADTHALPRAEAETALVVWPPEAAAPEHVSLVARGADALDDSRAHWFAQEEAQRLQEDWNLLYVAATRAKQVLIASGSAPGRGTLSDTWYTRLQAAAELSAGAAEAQLTPAAPRLRSLADFLPAPLLTGTRNAPPPDTDAQRLGRGWHALLELGARADVAAVARACALSHEQIEQASAAADRVRRSLPQFFGARAQAELELVSAEGELLRVDRLVETDDALWIVDFKWRVTETERAPYEAQVRRYGAMMRQIRGDKTVRLALVTADGTLIEVAH